ncbi:hypothetical protein FE257_007832 [Aspergillus nanangensis]|uniref:FAD/NAD(P)-binding domain-containing protein n=1 Tax=Aspergillus nanangensis TaxID=2582783 RepID=A0AAD4GXY5_ASPNN|nr:hypothetical protein FE257_007832 [Aspergillus nanangensis]
MESNTVHDAVVIGAGPAGLSLAGALARQVHTVLVLDSGEYRNERSQHMHNVAGWDHVDPAVFRAKAKEDLQRRYASVEFQSAKAVEVRKVDNIFEAVDQEGNVYKGRKLGLATGVEDLIAAEVEGFAECWGRGVFHCLFCHGFEERGAPSAGVLSTSPLGQHPAQLVSIARMAKRLSDQVTIYTNGNHTLAAQISPLIRSSKISVDARPIARLNLVDSGPQVRIDFADGSASATEGFVSSHPKMRQRAEKFADELGLEMTDAGNVKVTAPFNETSLKGCFAVGDAATVMESVIEAMHMGFFAGVGCVAQLQEEMEARDEL